MIKYLLFIQPVLHDVNGNLSWGTDTLATETQLANKQDVLPGVSITPINYLYGPAHWISVQSVNASWVNQTTHSVFTSNGAGYDMYQIMPFTIGKTYTLKADVKLVGSSSVFVLGFELGNSGNFAQTFTSANGLNTSTYTTCSFQ